MNLGTFLLVSKLSKKLYKQISRTSPESAMKVLEKEKKIGMMTALITSAFFLTYIPITVLFLIDRHAGFTRPTAVLVTDAVAFFLVIVDPMIYIISHEKYRDGIKRLFTCTNSGFPAIQSETFRNSQKRSKIQLEIFHTKTVCEQVKI